MILDYNINFLQALCIIVRPTQLKKKKIETEITITK
jgi:hypothetical protein